MAKRYDMLTAEDLQVIAETAASWARRRSRYWLDLPWAVRESLPPKERPSARMMQDPAETARLLRDHPEWEQYG